MSEFHATTDSQSVVFSCHRDATTGKLSTLTGTESHQDGSSKVFEIPSSNVIGLTPSSDGNTFVLHFVEKVGAGQESSHTSPVRYKGATVTEPPPALLDELLASESSAGRWRALKSSSEPQPDFHVIVSTGSGTGLAQSLYEQAVLPLLSSLGLERNRNYRVHSTESETSLSELTESTFLPQANAGKLQNILLLSGDGGILDIVNTLLDGRHSEQYRRPSIAVLPMGTGNALAYSSNIGADNTWGLRTWLRGTPEALPLFKATFSAGARALFNEARDERPLHLSDGVATAYGAVVCSWGIHAGLVADSDTAEYRKFGVDRFKMAATEALFPKDGSPSHVYSGKVSILRSGHQQWEEIRHGEHSYVLAALVSNLEKTLIISPASQAVDGKLRLVHFGPLAGQEFMEIMGGAYQGGQHVTHAKVGYEEIEGLRIDFHEDEARWRRICVDGKIIRVEKGGWAEVRVAAEAVVDLVVLRS